MFERLPVEIVLLILSFEGSLLRERDGVYRKRIAKTDPRYAPLATLPIKCLFFSNQHGGYSYVWVPLNQYMDGPGRTPPPNYCRSCERIGQNTYKERCEHPFFTMTMHEYYEFVKFTMSKNGQPLEETRYVLTENPHK